MTKKQDIQRLAMLLEGDTTAHAEAAEDERALGGLALLLRESQPAVEPMRPEFRAELRAQVVEAARARTAEPALMTRLRDRVERFKYSTGLATATGIASVSLAGGGVAGAAEYAGPGDLLYPTKLAIEDARLAFDSADATRGRRALSYAAERLDEAAAAAADGDMDGAEVALRSAEDRTRVGRESVAASDDDAAVLDMVDALNAQAAALAELAPLLEGSAADAAADLSREVGAGLLDASQRLQAPVPATPVPAAPVIPESDDDGAAPALPDGSSAPDTRPDIDPSDQVAPPVDLPDDAPPILPEPPPVDLPEPDQPLPLPQQDAPSAPSAPDAPSAPSAPDAPVDSDPGLDLGAPDVSDAGASGPAAGIADPAGAASAADGLSLEGQ